MKILSVQQIRALDRETIAQTPISSIELMEVAATQCADWILDHFPNMHSGIIYCGAGNNGGDGLAIARLLGVAGWEVRVTYPVFAEPSPDFRTNLERLRAGGRAEIFALVEDDLLPEPGPDDLILDCLFGSGLSRQLDGAFERWVGQINAVPNLIVAIDIPSGLFADQPTQGIAVGADFTLTFEVPKLAFFTPESAEYLGDWIILPIGLDKEALLAMDSPWSYPLPEDFAYVLRARDRFAHKGGFGHALIIAGSRGMAGASVLSTQAALRSGAGLVTSHVPQSLYGILQTSVPEAMVLEDIHADYFSGVEIPGRCTAIGIGSGLGRHPSSAHGLKDLIMKASVPLVLDADALNILSEYPELLEQVSPDSILTPHIGEFERLFGSSPDHFRRLELLREVAVKYNMTIVLKGAFTAVAGPRGSVTFNPSGNPGMATGGSGDVLMGLITGLVAQGYAPLHAARLGVYLHGSAGDLAASRISEEAMIAGDLIDFLGNAFQELHRHRIVS